jgi:hypothetical protein
LYPKKRVEDVVFCNGKYNRQHKKHVTVHLKEEELIQLSTCYYKVLLYLKIMCCPNT